MQFGNGGNVFITLRKSERTDFITFFYVMKKEGNEFNI